MTTELVLARHGEALCNTTGLVGGPRTCTGLTDHGRDQVQRAASRLATEPAFDVLYTSPRRRTQDTAALLSTTLDLGVRTDDDLRGLDHGAADGLDWLSVKTRFGGRPQRYPDRPIADDAETWNSYRTRTRLALARLIAEHAGQRILVAAHGETIEAAFALLLDLPSSEREPAGIITGHASLTRWQQHRNRFGHSVWMLAAHNDTQHLSTTAESTGLVNDDQRDRLLTLAEHATGHPVEIPSPPLAHATGTVVHLDGDSTRLIGKIHRSRSRYDQEVCAYQDWAPHLSGRTPELLVADPDLPGIVLTTVPGTPLDELDLDPAEERTAFRHAGQLLHTLHRIPVAGDAAKITTYLAQRAEHWIRDLDGHLTSTEAELVREHMRALTRQRPGRVAACHLDFQPRNLLWHPEHGLHLIDFEHTRDDLAARDLVRLATRYWPSRPDLKTAFIDGYGPLSTNDAAVLHHCTALDAATTLAYGHRHGDTTVIEHARTLLDNLINECPR